MGISEPKFWLNLSSVVATTYIIVWYLFAPSINQCQMTFMMEPPKFIPVTISDKPTKGSSLNYPDASIDGKKDNLSQDYRLIMYSEFGFPSTINPQQDLKDSMPVLFIPGNAGGYQQVRSIASTCIRRQMQSLKAFKFVFYAIDFRSQLSGISGQLIEKQTLFVNRALNHIIEVHPIDTKGVVIIGHSAGGLIAKNLFTLTDFNPDTVPLLISLASPLKKPFIAFDDKMMDIYERANKFWTSYARDEISTIAISLSGGRLDKLVPAHLTMDSSFDLSVTTSSIKDVWLNMDHVSITWCRELMNKLSNLLSAILDKKLTRVIADRSVALRTIKEELLIKKNEESETNPVKVTSTEAWVGSTPYEIINFDSYLALSRRRMTEGFIVIKTESSMKKDMLFSIEHNGLLKRYAISECYKIEFGLDSQINCAERIDLTHLAQLIPTRRVEPKRSFIKLKEDAKKLDRYFILNFNSRSHQDQLDKNIPESLVFSKLDTESRSLYIPTLLELLFSKATFIHTYNQVLLPDDERTLKYSRFCLKNLGRRDQVINIRYETTCPDDEYPKHQALLFYENGYLVESVHSVIDKDKTQIFDLQLLPRPSVLNREDKDKREEPFIEFLRDGSCRHEIKIQVQPLELAIHVVQNDLGKVITGLNYLAHLAVVNAAFGLLDTQKSASIGNFQRILQFLGNIVIHFLVGDGSALDPSAHRSIYIDEVIHFLLVYTMTIGAFAFCRYFVNRVVDLAIITNKAQSFIRRTVGYNRLTPLGGILTRPITPARFTHSDFHWLMIIMAIGVSYLCSFAVISLLSIFILIKSKLAIDSLNEGSEAQDDENHSSKSSTISLFYRTHELLSSVAVMSGLALISNIPVFLVHLTLETSNSTSGNLIALLKDMNFMVAASSLLLVKFVCDKVLSACIDRPKTDGTSSNRIESTPSFAGRSYIKYLHVACICPILIVESNICHINLVMLASLAWLNSYLLVIRQ